MSTSQNQLVAAVFVSPDFLDIGRLRVWARTAARGFVVLLTDDPIDANSVLARQLRCEGVVHAIVRTATTLRGNADLQKAREERDAAMIAVASDIVIFGNVDRVGGVAGKPVIRY